MVTLKKLLEFCGIAIVPIASIIIPFIPNLHDAITEPDENYAYSTEYEKNPILEWNRAAERFLKKIDSSIEMQGDALTKPLLKKIGKEIANNLPAILSDTGFRPMDKFTVKIANMSSRHDLKNVRVHFINCEGVDSIRTYPDMIGSIKELHNGSMSVTATYGQLHRSNTDHRSVAYLMIYAEDASKCKAIVEAETAQGESAKGKSVNDVSDYNSSEYYRKLDQSKRFDLIWKIFVIIMLLSGFFWLKSIAKRI